VSVPDAAQPIAASGGFGVRGSGSRVSGLGARRASCQNNLKQFGFAALDRDITGLTAGAGNGGGTTVYRFREGVERFLITDINNPAASAMAQSELPVMWDMLCTKAEYYNHVPGGANVLYMDGHVAFLRYARDQEAPVNEMVAIAAALVNP